MNAWTGILNVVLCGVAVAAFLWGYRQRALLRRIQTGLIALREGRTDFRVQRDATDTEPVLKAFDGLAQELTARRSGSSLIQQQGQSASLIQRLCELLRAPLATIERRASQLVAGPASPSEQQEAARSIRAQLEGMLRLLSTPSSMSELQERLRELERTNGSSRLTMGPPTVLLLDDDGPLSDRLRAAIETNGWRLRVASGADAAAALATIARPQLVLTNGSEWRGEARGWRSLAALSDAMPSPSAVVWFYREPIADAAGFWWSPRETWLWPDDRARSAALVRRAVGEQWSFIGDPSLAGEMETAAAGAWSLTRLNAGEPAPPGSDCLLMWSSTGTEAPETATAIFVVRVRSLEERSADFAQGFGRLGGAGAATADAWWASFLGQWERHASNVSRAKAQGTG